MAILIYVALDLSLPAMPGAFVFEAADSVESIGGGRLTAQIAAVPVPAGKSFPLASRPRGDLRQGLARRAEVALLRCPQAARLPPAACDPSSPSEDAH